MPDFATPCEQASAEGTETGNKKSGSLEHCPYTEEHDPVLRALWQNAFVATRLYNVT